MKFLSDLPENLQFEIYLEDRKADLEDQLADGVISINDFNKMLKELEEEEKEFYNA